MGGAKKKSMAQMEKTQDQTDKKDEPGSKKGKAKTVVEKRPRGLQSPDISDPKFLAEVQRMGAITPFSIASQFNLRLSVAKDLLEDLEKKRLVRLVGGNEDQNLPASRRLNLLYRYDRTLFHLFE